jgi:agmatine deiminase
MANITYRMPAEWEQHSKTWMAFPPNKPDWQGKYESALQTWIETVRVLAEHERVNILVYGVMNQQKCVDILNDAHVNMEHVVYSLCPTTRCWVRNSAPIFVHSTANTVGALLFKFNGREKYAHYQLDERVGSAISKAAEIPAYYPENDSAKHIVLESGAIDVNGCGTLLTTKDWLQTHQYKPTTDKEGYERVFKRYLGIHTTIWLEGNIKGSTNGHIDNVARFAGPNDVLTASELNREDPNHAILAENSKTLRAANLNVRQILMPSPVYYKGNRLPASYLNFYVGNSVILVPAFNDPLDSTARSIIGECFPERNAVGIYCRDYILGGGGIHCSTMQQPNYEKK